MLGLTDMVGLPHVFFVSIRDGQKGTTLSFRHCQEAVTTKKNDLHTA